MIPCPYARTAKQSPCKVPGCDHFAGLGRAICTCCLKRLGGDASERYSLAKKFASFDKFIQLETELLAEIIKLPPREYQSRGVFHNYGRLPRIPQRR